MTSTAARPARPDRLDSFAPLLDRSAEPLGFAAGDANLTRYVGNGPTNAIDPSGLKDDGRNMIKDSWWPGLGDIVPKGHDFNDPVPTNEWFQTEDLDYAYKDESGYTLAVKLVEICDSKGNTNPRLVASVFIFNEKDKLVGQLLLTKPPDENGNPQEGSWTLLPVSGKKGGEGGIGFKIINPSDGEQGKIEVSGKLGGFLENIDAELGIEIKLLDEEGKFKPAVEGGTICVSFALGRESNERELKEWYEHTTKWYDEHFRRVE